MRHKSKLSDYSPLFEGLLSRHRSPLRIEDRGQVSVLFISGAEVEGPRQILEKVRDGILRNGGPRSLWDGKGQTIIQNKYR